ncbi:MAG: hypothetical protein B6U89_04650 [Desulfurococcales archaeon ex4484_58]|nr:MAG: hypothetical protein B6U89_04650 [Desulfurococcales archaeon ex4484_58]
MIRIGRWRGRDVVVDNRSVEKIERHGLSIDDVKWVLSKPSSIYFNTRTNRRIVVRLKNGEGIIVVLDIYNDKAYVVTAWYASEARDLVKRRRKSGRWI